ncbi:MAG TPA: hypothetical protein VLJ86_03585 [Ramlibacter sp.]|nr:hypothetical protein [Ramlibacter sp.]
MDHAQRRMRPSVADPPPRSYQREDDAPPTGDDPKRNLKDDAKRKTPPDKPGAGRTTPMGRKMESPASIKTAGPSGQRGRTQHQKRHANK